MMILPLGLVVVAIAAVACAEPHVTETLPHSLGSHNPGWNGRRFTRDTKSIQRDDFLDNLVSNMTVSELGMENKRIPPFS